MGIDESKKMREWFVFGLAVGVLALSGCFPQSVPLAVLPMDASEAAARN